MDAIASDGDPDRIYSHPIRAELAKRIALRPEKNCEDFFEQLEQLGCGLKLARSKAKKHGDQLDPRRAKDILITASDAAAGLTEALEVFDSAMEELEELQSVAGTVRQLMGSFNRWDALDDARHLIVEFGERASTAVRRFRQEMGTSPQRPDPVRGWAWLVWCLYKQYSQSPAIGRRAQADEEPGRFQAVLELLANPLGIDIKWRTIERHLREEENVRKGRATKPGT
ncbi:hypothetical protein [Microvirga antarctica]|uniref:hypothetical protein n=1 Tax=Microvirga antarctica TaxID=2819233 RepID=UPI001B300E62|nr:hypothetical protein [Microvirga antarctica]